MIQNHFQNQLKLEKIKELRIERNERTKGERQERIRRNGIIKNINTIQWKI